MIEISVSKENLELTEGKKMEEVKQKYKEAIERIEPLLKGTPREDFYVDYGNGISGFYGVRFWINDKEYFLIVHPCDPDKYLVKEYDNPSNKWEMDSNEFSKWIKERLKEVPE